MSGAWQSLNGGMAMKILHVVNRYYPFIGGTENYVYNLSRELVKLGHEVTVVCAAEPKRNSETIEGVRVVRLNYAFKIANTNVAFFLPFEIMRTDFDVLHTYIPHPWSADWAAWIACIKNKPLVLTYNNDIPEKGKYQILTWIYNRLFLRIILRIARIIICTQEKYAEYSKLLRQIKERDKIIAIPCGVDVEQFFPIKRNMTQTKRIFFLSVLDEFHRYKGLDYLLEAFSQVLNKRKDVSLFIGGEGVLKEEYENKARKRGISDYVVFLGCIPASDLNRYFNECDIFVLPSISSDQEGFGIVLLEAMACAKPVITTSIVGPAEQIRQWDAGLIAEPRNVDALAAALMQLLGDHNRAQAMGQRARQLAEQKYGWRSVAQQMETLYTEVLREYSVKFSSLKQK